jgi:aminoglycoside phosphotransferase (APT) family kinase protein
MIGEVLVDDLRARVRSCLATVDDAELEDLSPLVADGAGGNSSLTYVASLRGGTLGDRLVVKVAPQGLAPVRNRDVLRQAKLLRGLHGVAGVAVPEIVFSSPGEPPELPPFFAMKFVTGDIAEPVIEDQRPPADVVARRARAAACMLARLHDSDPGALGVDDEPEFTLEDELLRWRWAFDSAGNDLQFDHATIASQLGDTLPAAQPTVISHGDYRLGNMLCQGPTIAAIIDWEIWSRTDPRMDLVWLLFMCDPSHPDGRGPVAGMPTATELIAAYQGERGLALPDLDWIRALVSYKQAATCALLAKHARRRHDQSGVRFGRLVPALLANTREILGKGNQWRKR